MKDSVFIALRSPIYSEEQSVLNWSLAGQGVGHTVAGSTQYLPMFSSAKLSEILRSPAM